MVIIKNCIIILEGYIMKKNFINKNKKFYFFTSFINFDSSIDNVL